MKKNRKLQIKLLSKSGELLRCIDCFAGQVSVFRAVSPKELQPFQRALAGIPGPEKFVIYLRGESYNPDQVNLIGFGETFPAEGLNAFDYLKRAGMPEGAISANLLSYGLDGIENTSCESLSRDQQRRLRFLGASCSGDKALILNNPFEEISSQWRERFAELIVSFARTNDQIVVVVSMPYRPECWIDNEFISRIQVGENIQKTIGFGSAASDVQNIIDQVRTMINDEEQAEEILQQNIPNYQSGAFQQAPPSPPPQSASHQQTDLTRTEQAQKLEKKKALSSTFIAPLSASLDMAFQKSQRKRVATLLIGLGCLVIFALYYFLPASKDSAQQVVINNKPPKKEEPKKPLLPLDKIQPGKDKPNIKNPFPFQRPKDTSKEKPRPIRPQRPSPPAKDSQYALNLYPSNIQKAVLDSFNGTDSTARKPYKQKPKKEAKASTSNEVPSLFSALEQVSGTGDNVKGSKKSKKKDGSFFGRTSPASRNPFQRDEPDEHQDEDVEERRERIRQKFLEAIRRASEDK